MSFRRFFKFKCPHHTHFSRQFSHFFLLNVCPLDFSWWPFLLFPSFQMQLWLLILAIIFISLIDLVDCRLPRGEILYLGFNTNCILCITARFRKRGPSGFSLARIQKQYDDDYDSTEDSSSSRKNTRRSKDIVILLTPWNEVTAKMTHRQSVV